MSVRKGELTNAYVKTFWVEGQRIIPGPEGSVSTELCVGNLANRYPVQRDATSVNGDGGFQFTLLSYLGVVHERSGPFTHLPKDRTAKQVRETSWLVGLFVHADGVKLD